MKGNIVFLLLVISLCAFIASTAIPAEHRITYEHGNYYPEYRLIWGKRFARYCSYGCKSFDTEQEALNFIKGMPKQRVVVWSSNEQE